MALAYERGPAPLLNVAQSLFAFNDARVRFVNVRRREFALMQELLDNRNRFRRNVRIVLELMRHCEHVPARAAAQAAPLARSQSTARSPPSACRRKSQRRSSAIAHAECR